jgi:hypothetical protein
MIQPELQEKSQEDILDESERGPEKKPSFFAAVKIVRDPRFLSLSLAELAASIGVLIPLYYMQSKSHNGSMDVRFEMVYTSS